MDEDVLFLFWRGEAGEVSLIRAERRFSSIRAPSFICYAHEDPHD